jgi:hypothetical protein
MGSGKFAGSVKQCALLEVASVSGGPEPLAALALVEEAGWSQDQATNFHRVLDFSFQTTEHNNRPNPESTAGALLKQLAILNPAAAQSYLLQNVPETQRATIAKQAGLNLTNQ